MNIIYSKILCWEAEHDYPITRDISTIMIGGDINLVYMSCEKMRLLCYLIVFLIYVLSNIVRHLKR